MSGSNSSPAGDNAPADVPLALAVHAAPSAAGLMASERTTRGRWTMLLVVFICALPVLASYFTFYVLRPQGRAYGDLPQPAVAMPEGLQLRELDGALQPAAALKGQWLLVVVDGGSCVDDCEQRLYLQRQLREMLGKERDKVEKLWLVVDEAPLAAPLRRSLEATPAMRILRAEREAVAAWLQPAAGHSLTDHLYLIDPQGRWMWRAPARPEPQRVKRDLDKLLRAAASWDQPGR